MPSLFKDKTTMTKLDATPQSSTFSRLARESGVAMALIVLVFVFSMLSPLFLTAGNISNIFTQIAINVILAVGMTFVILIGGIDLSVGSVMALCAVIAGTVLKMPELSVELAILLAVASGVLVGGACGLFNGLVSSCWGIPSFIVTLGMLNIARGGALQWTDARSIYEFPNAFNNFATTSYFGLPAPFLVAAFLVLVGWVVLTRTVFGRLIYAIGNNEEAVRLAGHNVMGYKIAAFTICGATVGIAAIMYMTRLTVASPILGIGFELNAIAAVIIGGTSLNGGRGSIFGTLLGACIIGVLANGLILIGVGDFVRQIITGVVIILAVVVDAYRMRLTRK
jgi:ribose transport system permease protein